MHLDYFVVCRLRCIFIAQPSQLFRMIRFCVKLLFPFLLLLTTVASFGQKQAPKKYPSLFWEITGNGLKKPSYLFGTMHVSSKMAFHLSDSFYYALKNVDAVALELNPDLWQGQMVRLDQLKQNYANFVQAPAGDFLNENSFRINKYEDEFKAALNTEPTVVNSLLYRTYKQREDFEEDTFLDLYIFQTGKKLGKRSAGVEDYYQTEKVVLEAYADMAKEKKRKIIDADGESIKDISKKIQEAYRSGDLDLMDSLDILTERSAAFREKFLYKRNEIQAESIDTIIKKSALFVGVGAAHLPGPRGVIELLRKKGYSLRPIKIVDRDAAKKEETDQLKVPVHFSIITADDDFYKVDMPGPLFKMKDEYQQLDRRQYSDMSNGSYYLVTRVKTHAAFLGQSDDLIIKKTDSLLYENIPGKILKKTMIERNGFKGFDITNRTRRGDLQRYNIFITPFEIVVFKMSGKEHYVDGAEAKQFFSSIRLKETKDNNTAYAPAQGGFSIKMPGTISANLNTNGNDGMNRWEYESIDQSTGDAYLVLKKSVYNYKFLEEDTFDLKLMEESFRSGDNFDRQLQRKLSSCNGYPCLEVKEALKDGSIITARYIIKGPHYYCIAARSKNPHKNFSDYFNSFQFTPYRYFYKNTYVDTFMHFTVTTPVAPELDEDYRAKLEKLSADISNSTSFNGNNNNSNSYWPRNRNALFTSDSTGETINVSVQQYPTYYYVKDSALFWKNEWEDYFNTKDLILHKKDFFTLKNGIKGYRFILRDTGSSRTINRMIMLKDNYMFSLVTIGDTISRNDDFINSFYSSFAPEEKKLGRNIFVNNLDSFFNDLFSKDSIVNTRAQQSISNIYYGEKGVPKIIAAINKLSPNKSYIDTKTKLIAELGYIKDTTKPLVVNYLKKIYEQAGDTSIFKNEVMKALARHKTTDAITVFKELILQDPPFFTNDYDYNSLFNSLGDSLKLAAGLYPELLELATIDDYKEPVISLLVDLVDSSYTSASQYKNYFTKIYFDAKIELKKQQGKEEKKADEEDNKEADDDPIRTNSFSDGKNDLTNHEILLMPFYDDNVNVPKFFDKLLHSSDESIRMNTAILLLRNNKRVADSILLSFAAKDQWRSALYTGLEKIKRLDKFPGKHKTQLEIARSYLVADKEYSKMDSIVLVSKEPVSYAGKTGLVYFFKYRVKKEGDWKIGISGLQPANMDEVSSDNKLTSMTDKKLKDDKPIKEQFNQQLKYLLFAQRKSAKNFFDEDGNGSQFSRNYDER